MRHNLCRSFHPWCPGVKNRCLWNYVIYVFCIASSVCGEPTAHWRIPLQTINSAELCCLLFALLVERWCLIKGFRTAGPVYSVFICSHWILLINEAKLWCLLSCLAEWAVEQTVDMQVSRKLMKPRLCYCYVICISVIDDIIAPVCGETTGHLWIPVVRAPWSGTLVVQCAANPSPVDSPHKRWASCFLSCLPLRAV